MSVQPHYPWWNPTIWPPAADDAPAPEEPLVARLERITRDLQGYIDGLATGLAKPIVRAAEDRAAALVAEARSETKRQEDLVAELRRWLEMRDRQEAAQARAVLRLAEHLSDEARTDFVVENDIRSATAVVERYEKENPNAPGNRRSP